MTNRMGRMAAVVCGGAALAVAVGLGFPAGEAGAGEPLSGAIGASSGVAPTGNDGGAVPVQPVGGGACIIGLNCGCIPRHTCPTPHPHPGTAGANQHNAPAPQNP